MTNRVQSLEFLRFIAALSVVCFHVPVLEMGNFGVDVFFIISGYVMMISTARHSDQFLLKRIIRIVPTYWIVTVAVFGLALAMPSVLGSTSADVGQLAKSLLFIPFDKGGLGHFPLLTVGWTLNYEMYFYLLFFAGCLISHRYRALIAAGILIGLSLIFSTQNGFLAGVYSNSIILEFAYGMLLYAAMVERDRRVSIGLALIILVGLASHGTLDQRAVMRGLPAIVTVLVFMKLLEGRWQPPFAAELGAISYALYVVHPFPLGAISAGFSWFSSDQVYQQLTASLLVVIVSVAAAFGFYHLIEKPIIGALRTRFIRRRMVEADG